MQYLFDLKTFFQFKVQVEGSVLVNTAWKSHCYTVCGGNDFLHFSLSHRTDFDRMAYARTEQVVNTLFSCSLNCQLRPWMQFDTIIKNDIPEYVLMIHLCMYA